MPTLRSSIRGQGSQAPVPPTKGTQKVKTGRTAKGKVAKTIKVNNLLSMVPNTTEDSDVSTVPLPTLPYLSGFGSMLNDSNPLIGYGPRPRGCVSSLIHQNYQKVTQGTRKSGLTLRQCSKTMFVPA